MKKAAALAIILIGAFPIIAQPGISRHAKPHAPHGVSWKAGR